MATRKGASTASPLPTSGSAPPVLMIDSREPTEIPPALTEMGIPNERRQLQVGDFWFRSSRDEMVVITRKSSDLMQSLYDGHFQDELNRCIEFVNSSGGGKLIYLEEGKWAPNLGRGLAYFKRAGPKFFRRVSESGGDRKALAGIQLSLQAAGLWHVSTADVNQTTETLAQIYNKANEGWPTKLVSSVTRPPLQWTDDGRVRYLRGLWRGLRESVADDLLQRHGSISAVLDYVTSDPKKAVKETPNLGKTGVAKLMEILND